MADIDNTLKQYIDEVDKASTGSILKQALFKMFSGLQNVNIPAKTLAGLSPSDLMTKPRLIKLFEEGLVFDALPKKGSTKAVQSGGVYDLFGDIKDVYDNYEKLFKIKESDIVAGDKAEV